MPFEILLEPGMALFLFFTIPALTVSLSIVFYLLYNKLKKAGHQRALAWLVEPLKIQPFVRSKRFQKNVDANNPSIASSPRSMKSKVKYAFAQLGLRVLFFFIIVFFALFTLELGILFHETGHGIFIMALGQTWLKTIIFLFGGVTFNEFTSPPANLTAYYSQSSLIFLGGDLTEFIVGAVFLLFLLVPQVRKSFFASLFCFIMSEAALAAPVFAWYGESWNLLYGTANVYSDTVQYLYWQTFLANGATPTTIIFYTTIFMVILQFIVIVVGGKLWRFHYPNHRFSHIWFIVLVEIPWVALFFISGGGFFLV